MRARAILGLALALTALGLAAPPPGAARTARIGVLEVTRADDNEPNLSAFRQRLAELGHVEGRTFVLEYRSADGRAERLPDLARELARLEVDVIVTRGSAAALSAKHATRTIPIVMAASGDPLAEGIVANLARPGGNVTGFHVMVPPEVGGKRLQLLKEVAPATARIGILWNTGDIQSPLLVRETEKMARAMRLSLTSLEMQRPRGERGFGAAFEATLMAQVDAVIAVEDTLTFADRARIVEFAAMSRLPAMYGLREFVDDGGLMSYGTDRRDLFRRGATYVHRLLNGARVSELPVEAPTRFELAINLTTAGRLRLAIPPALLRQADHLVR